MADIEQKVKDIIINELGVEAEKVTPEASFVEDLGADSLDTVELVMAFEEEFGMEIPDEEAEKLQTVGDAIKYITSPPGCGGGGGGGSPGRRRRPPDVYSNGRSRDQRLRSTFRTQTPERLMNRRVVITGTGLLTAVGNDVRSTWDALLAGKSGGAPITQFDATDFPVRFACELKGFDPAEYVDRKEVKRTDRYSHLALAASVQAMREAGMEESLGDADPERVGVIIGSGIGGIKTFEEQHAKLVERGPGRVSPFFVPMFISDIATGLVSMRFGAKGPNYAVVSACATGAHAIGNAFRHIRAGDADVMIAGGTEASVTPMAIAGFANMTALSTRNDSPQTASRPFDAGRDGFVMGEGAGVMVLEELEHARARGATIIAEVVGYGLTGDAYHITGQPEAHEGLQRAMRAALREAGATPAEVDYVNAHGTSTPLNDSNETAGIKAVLGERAREIVVGSTKSMTGHTLGAAGAIEGVISALVCREGVIPPTINLTTPDPECDLDYAPDGARERAVRLALSNSAGFGGHNVSLAIRRWDG